MAGAWSTYVGELVFVEEPEGKRPLERSRRKLKNNIKMEVQEMGKEGHGLN
jgi:hypothetical protein